MIFVSMGPRDRQVVLATEEQIKQFEIDWQRSPIRIGPPLDRRELEKHRKRLTGWFRKPSEADVTWAYFNDEAIKYAKEGQWGLYSSTKLGMANFLEVEGKLTEAFRSYLEVCYFDLNDPDDAFLAPVVIERIVDLILRMALSESDVRREFLEIAALRQKGLKRHVSPEKAWGKLATEFYG